MRLSVLAAIFLIAGAHAGTVQYVYDGLGRLIGLIDEAGQTTTYTYDAAGNLLSVTRSGTAQVSIVSFVPDHGKAGDSVTIFGSRFVPNAAQNTVTFNGRPAVVSAASATSIVATVPAGTTTGPISVSNVNGAATSANAFRIVLPPVITGVTPNVVARGATTQVQISGSNLAFATSVTFAQPGMTANILAGATNQRLPVNVTVSSSVPVGSYGFTVTDAAGTTDSGAVTVTLGVPPPIGDSMMVTSPTSVFFPFPAQSAPTPGDSMAVASPVSVFLPFPAQSPPTLGDSMAVSSPLSVFLPFPAQSSPTPGDSVAIASPVSVFLPFPAQSPPTPGDSMSVSKPVSVSMP